MNVRRGSRYGIASLIALVVSAAAIAVSAPAQASTDATTGYCVGYVDNPTAWVADIGFGTWTEESQVTMHVGCSGSVTKITFTPEIYYNTNNGTFHINTGSSVTCTSTSTCGTGKASVYRTFPCFTAVVWEDYGYVTGYYWRGTTRYTVTGTGSTFFGSGDEPC